MLRRRALPWLAVLLYAAGCLAVPATTLAVALTAPAGCGCDGEDAGCCGAACCAPATPSCCGGGTHGPPADRTWDPRCTCGGPDPAAAAHLALDLHVPTPAVTAAAAPDDIPFPSAAAPRVPAHTPAPDDPVPRPSA